MFKVCGIMGGKGVRRREWMYQGMRDRRGVRRTSEAEAAVAEVDVERLRVRHDPVLQQLTMSLPALAKERRKRGAG